MIEVDRSVTGVTIQREFAEGPGLRIDPGRVTARAAVGELLLIPRELLVIHSGRRQRGGAPVSAERELRVEYREFAVALLLQEPRAMAAAEEVFYLLRHLGQVRRRFERFEQFRRVFALPHRHAVRVLLP